MSIPIVCYAVAEETQRHRFSVARVEADLVCTACGSDDIDLDDSVTAAKTAFNDMEMAEVGEVASVKQHTRCSTCLTEHVVTAVDPAQPMPACPSCGALTLSPAGSTLASRHHADSLRDMMDGGSKVKSSATCKHCNAAIEKRGDIWEASGKTEGADICMANKGTKSQYGGDHAPKAGTTSALDAVFAQEGLSPITSPVPCVHGVTPVGWCCSTSAPKAGTTSALDAVFATLYAEAETSPSGIIHQVTEDAFKGNCAKCGTALWKGTTHNCTAAVLAKIEEITFGVLATNTGMDPVQAHRIAVKTVRTYPQVIKGN